MLSTRRPRQQPPGVSGDANGPATDSNNNRNGTGPSRARARLSASCEGNTTAGPRAAHDSVPASLRTSAGGGPCSDSHDEG